MPPPTPAPARVRRRRGGRTGQAVAGAALPCDVNTPQTLSFIPPPPRICQGRRVSPRFATGLPRLLSPVLVFFFSLFLVLFFFFNTYISGPKKKGGGS